MPGTHNTPSEDEVERQLEALSRWMDSVLRIPGVGWRIGLDPIIGAFFGVGDTVTSLVSLYMFTTAWRFGLSRITLTRMALNIAVDWLIGSIPIVGDLFDIWWKANVRNYELLRGRLDADAAQKRRNSWSDWLFVIVVVTVLVAVLIASIAFTLWLMSLLIHALTSARVSG